MEIEYDNRLKKIEKKLELIELETSSLNNLIKADDGDLSLINFISNDINIENDVYNKTIFEHVMNYLNQIGGIEVVKTFEILYGIKDNEPKTYQRTGELLGISKQAVEKRVNKYKKLILEEFNGGNHGRIN